MTEIAPGVTRHNCVYGYYVVGAKNALLRAGIAKSEWFFDGHDRTQYGKTIRTVHTEQNGIPVECNQPARGLCIVRFRTGKDERDPMTRERIRAQSLGALFGQDHALSRQHMADIAAADTDFQRLMQRITGTEA